MIKIFTNQKNSDDNLDFINEFVTAPLYRRTLYDRAPIIEGVKSSVPNQVCFRSKFLRDFQTLYDFVGKENRDYSKLKNVEGMEKAFAAMWVWGEIDMHWSNVGVMEQGKGSNKWVVAKIDHGKSANQFFSYPGNALENLAWLYDQIGYYGKIPLKVDKLKNALDEIIYKISDEELETLIKSRIGQLKDMGVNITNLNFCFSEDFRAVSDIRNVTYL